MKKRKRSGREDWSIRTRQVLAALTTAVAASLITASSLAAAAAIRRATSVDDKEKDQVVHFDVTDHLVCRLVYRRRGVEQPERTV